MANIDFSAISDLENLISQTKFERIFFFMWKKIIFFIWSKSNFQKNFEKKNNKILFQKFAIS